MEAGVVQRGGAVVAADVEIGTGARAPRGATRVALRFAALSAPAVVVATVAVGWIYSPYTEFDRPSMLGVAPFLGGVGLWSIGAASLALARDRRPRRLGLLAAALLVAAFVAAACVFAPEAPLRQAAWALVTILAVPNAVWAVLAFPGAAMLAVRAVVAGIGLAFSLPVVAVLVIVALSRSLPLLAAGAFAALVVHLPVTALPSLLRSGSDDDGNDVDGGVMNRRAGLTFAAPVALVLAAVLAAVGVVAKPAAPAESDPLLAEVAAAHRDLNAAVGWDSWRPSALAPTRARLERAAVLSGGDAPELLEAAARVRDARAHDDRDTAVIAHRIVAGFELKVRESRAFVQRDPGGRRPDR